MSIPSVPYRKIRTVFLDAGGTIAHIDHELFQKKLAQLGVPTPDGAVARAEAAARPWISEHLARGRSTEAEDTRAYAIRSLLAALGHKAGVEIGEDRGREVAAALAEWFFDPDVAFRLWLKVPDGVPESLQRLREAGFRLFVVSNSDGRCEERLERCGLRPHVDAVVDSEVVGYEKPDPRIFEHALTLSGASPAETLHVGDLYSVDIAGARAAGVHGVLMDPYGDWGEVDCDTAADIPTLAQRLIAD